MAKAKIQTVMNEFKNKTLNIGKSKKKVTKRKQAIAIALNSARKSGEKVMPMKSMKPLKSVRPLTKKRGK